MTRSETILKLIVEHFIKTAQPVGSQTLIDEYKLNYSSATIRAEMNGLEKDGYLEKTHTSSGRIPSALGYQYYVEHLREDRLDNQVKYALASILEKKALTAEEIIKQSCQILSSMTNLASVVLGPKANQEKLVSVQLIPLGSNAATAVFVTDQGYVENKTFIIDESISLEDLAKSMTLLNDRLKGTPIVDLVSKMEAMRPALTDYLVGQDAIYQAILEAFLRFASSRMDLYGKENLLDQPEFIDDARKLRKVLGLLDDPEALRKALEEAPIEEQGIQVKIGTPDPELGDMSIISASLAIPGGEGTSINLVGPTRMDYDKALATLKYITQALEEYFAKEGGPSCKKNDA